MKAKFYEIISDAIEGTPIKFVHEVIEDYGYFSYLIFKNTETNKHFHLYVSIRDDLMSFKKNIEKIVNEHK